MKNYDRVYARIDLDAITYNMEQMKENIGEGAQMIAVIKTDGYGHGALPIARKIQPLDYVWGFATATLEEAILLRKGNITKPILVLGCIFPDQYEAMITNEIRPAVYTYEMAEAMNACAGKLGKTAILHIKLDTGMGRIGFDARSMETQETIETILKISKMQDIRIEGIFTHFSKADETDKSFTYLQHERFVHVVETLQAGGIAFDVIDCDNSAGIIDLPEFKHTLVRAGISLYGLHPSEEVDLNRIDLRPALSLKSRVSFVKEVPEGTPISYGGTFIADKAMKIATIPVGYGDGYPRSLSNKGGVLIHGQRAGILGRVCMDQFMVDVTDIPDVKFMDEVTLIGEDGDESITAEELGEISGRFNYELVCDLNKRVPRVYVGNGIEAFSVDFF